MFKATVYEIFRLEFENNKIIYIITYAKFSYEIKINH